VSRPEGYGELSPGQRQLWFLYRLDPDSGAYNIGTALQVSGALDVRAMERAFNALISRYPCLRAVIVERDGNPCQRVLDTVRGTMAVEDLRTLSADDQRVAIMRISRLEATAPFDLSIAPPIRLRLLQLDACESRLLMTVHHIAADGRSMQVLMSDLFGAYRAFAANREPDWEAVTPLADFHEAENDADYASDLEYWRRALRELPQGLDLPTDLPRPVKPAFKGVRATTWLDEDLSIRLRDLARREQATLFCVLLAGWQTLLSRLSGQTDIPVGTPTSVRPEGCEDAVGMMVNTIIVRGDLSSAPSFAQLVRQTRDFLFDALDHRALPFDRVVENLAPGRERGRNPLFQSLITLDPAPNAVAWTAGIEPPLSVAPVVLDDETAKFDLSLAVAEDTDGRLRASVNAAADLFLPKTAERVASYFHTLLTSAVDDPDTPVSLLPLAAPDDPLSSDARHGDNVRYPYVTPTELLAERARVAPDSVAVSYSADCQLTYGQFTARVNQLSHRLRRAGVRADTVVGVCLPRCADLLIAVHAIAAAGGAYLPLDPELPAHRLSLMARDAKALLIVTASDSGHGARTFDGPQLLTLDHEQASLETEPDIPLGLRVPPDALAYVIFTSGSTGTPKGVGVSYSSLVNRLAWMQQYFQLTPDDRVLYKTPFGFDVSVWELFWPLSAGARVVVADPGGHRDPGYLATLMEREAVTVVHFVPSVLDVFLDEVRSGNMPALRLLFSSGEALGGDIASRALDLLPHAQLHNLYGPTETAVDVTWHPVVNADRAVPIPIGKPVPNTRAEVLSAEMQRCPVGIPGELFLGGVQLARGYVNRPGLTAERFVPDPYGPSGSRLYRTGDLVRLRDDATLEYLGRLDTQIKINGLRIELGEVEGALAAEPEVRVAAVTAVNDGSGKRLVAYLVPAAQVGTDVFRSRDWTERLRRRIPAYMIPAQYVTLASLPLSRNGKLDRAALPAPEAQGPAAADVPLAPGAETAVATVWREVLGITYVGPEDNFFSIGGDSMRSLRVVSRLRAAGYTLTLEDLFTYSTPRTLAALLEDPGREKNPAPPQGMRTSAAQAGDPAGGAFSLLRAEDRARLEAMGAMRKDPR
jgi:amino acid adenylation domain-containing protein